jgi:hypothetical protein
LERDLGDQAAAGDDDQRAELAQQPPAPEEPAAVLEQFQARIEELTQERDQARRALNQARDHCRRFAESDRSSAAVARSPALALRLQNRNGLGALSSAHRAEVECLPMVANGDLYNENYR